MRAAKAVSNVPQIWETWATIGTLVYLWIGVALVVKDFQAGPVMRPAYARQGGPHVLISVLYLPIATLLFFSVGGPHRVLKILWAAVVHFGIILLVFWGLSFLIESEWIRLTIIGALIAFGVVSFLFPVRHGV